MNGVNVKSPYIIITAIARAGVIKTNYKEMTFRVKCYVSENWGSPFITLFMLLLISVVALIALGLPYAADSVATYAFYALATGVTLQLACLLKYRKKSEVPDL